VVSIKQMEMKNVQGDSLRIRRALLLSESMSLGQLMSLHVPRDNGQNTWIFGNLRKGGLSHLSS
jgi:hypothetical protein